MNTVNNSNSGNGNSKGVIITIVVIALLAVAAYAFMHMPDNRTTGERVGDAVDSAAQGNIGDAAGQLGDKSPAEKAGDAVKNATE
ncbi:MAG: hypothetical protein JWM96_1305 [Alphaproteobacteria bacterium]|nr:hypothetical protein [Alphaproteobacteria bacterium]